MKIQQFILSDRVKVTFLPKSYTFEIDVQLFGSDWEDTFEDREAMLECAQEQIAIAFAEFSTDEEHEFVLAALEQIKL